MLSDTALRSLRLCDMLINCNISTVQLWMLDVGHPSSSSFCFNTSLNSSFCSSLNLLRSTPESVVVPVILTGVPGKLFGLLVGATVTGALDGVLLGVVLGGLPCVLYEKNVRECLPKREGANIQTEI